MRGLVLESREAWGNDGGWDLLRGRAVGAETDC